MADPNGINYPENPELRHLLAQKILKLQSAPERRQAVEDAEKWPEYSAGIVTRLQKASKQQLDKE